MNLVSKALRMARVNEGSHSFLYLPPTRLYTIEMSHAFCFYSQPQSITAFWLVLISRPTEGRRLSWLG